VSAVDVVDQVRKLIMRDGPLVMLEHIPARLATQDVDVVGSMESQRKDQPQE
jgi:hypothetical protein